MSRSRSGSRSEGGASSASSDSVNLPSPPPQDDVSAGVDMQSSIPVAAQNGGEEPISLFIGLGPSARSIKVEDLKQFLQDATNQPSAVQEVRIRGRCAFADIATKEAASQLIAALDGQLFQEKTRLAVQISRHKRDEKPERPERRRPRPEVAEGAQTLFVGLGPAGGAISDGELIGKLEEACPLRAFRRRAQCAFIEVRSVADAERLIGAMNNQYIGEARLSVQYSREGLKRERRVRSFRGERDERDEREERRRRSVTRDGRRSRRRERSGSRDRRRRRRGHSYSPSRSYSSYSSRSRSRSRGRRSYSSSRSSTHSEAPRDRRDRRDRHRASRRN